MANTTPVNGQITDSVAVGIGPGARIDLVDHGITPPGGVRGTGRVELSGGFRHHTASVPTAGGGVVRKRLGARSPWFGAVDEHVRGPHEVIAERGVLRRRQLDGVDGREHVP